MKVRELMAMLAKADPDADVCCFSDVRSGAQTLENVAVWRGVYDRPMPENWLRYDTVDAPFVGLMNPVDFAHDGASFTLVKELEE